MNNTIENPDGLSELVLIWGIFGCSFSTIATVLLTIHRVLGIPT